MAPSSGKRKRPDRPYSQEDAGRPSPHRPDHLGMASHGNTGSPRGGYGGRGRGGSRRGSAYGSHPSNSQPSNTQPRQELQEQTQAARPVQVATPVPSVPVYQPPALFEDSSDDPIAPYVYDYLTDDVVASWKDGGRQKLLESFAQLDAISTSVAIQELVRSGLDKRIPAAEAGEVIRGMIAQAGEGIDVEPLFVDCISLLGEKDHKRRSLAVIAASTGIDPEIFRHELDVQLLQSLQLVRSTFDRMRTRKTTNVLYRQANFNLLREESEGYAKLMTDFYNTSGDSIQTTDRDLAKDAFNRIMALVGAFDLDVGRVLDLTMDISAAGLVKYYRFFIKFYRCSSWWPENIVIDNIKWIQDGPSNCPSWALPGSNKSRYDETDIAHNTQLRLERDTGFWEKVRNEGMSAFFELGARRIIDFDAILPLLEQEVQAEPDAKGRDITADQRKRINENRKYMKATKTLPPQGNPDAAQLLGFKLRYYAEPQENDALPENLVYFAALLIKIGFISLRDLYPHLYPSDKEMEEVKSIMEAEKAERDRNDRPGGGSNALTAAVLTDDSKGDDIPIPLVFAKTAAESKEEKPKVWLANQKIILLKALLAIGAIPEALFILGKFPWLIDLDAALPTYLHRLARQMLSELAEQLRPLADRDGLQSTKTQVYDTTPYADGTVRADARSRLKLRFILGLERGEQGDGWEEQHYYTDWDENVPVCRTIDDFWALSTTLLNCLGVKIGQDVKLMTTILRLAQHDLHQNNSPENKTRWLEYIKRILLPALTLTKHNPGVNQEMFTLLSNYDISTRFKLYEEWHYGKTSRLPDVKAAFDKNKMEVKDVTRRITNESGKKQARALAKVAFSSPSVVITTVINQLESYMNMIPGLVDSVRYLNPLAFDMLTYILIRSLGGGGRGRIQADGMLTSQWLQALSRFVALLFTKYPYINTSPVLLYVASELCRGDSTNLELIDQVVTEMAGIRSDTEFTDEQLTTWCNGGKQFQYVVLQQVGNLEHLRQSSAKRLMKALSKSDITAQILIAIAQESQMYAHRPGSQDMPLKVLANNLDKISRVFSQYLDLLQAFASPSEFEEAVPDVVDLVGDFGLSPALAFTICRQAIDHQRSAHDAEAKAETNVDAEMQDATSTPWHPVLNAIATRLPAVTGDLSDRISMQFFVAFWTMTPQDLKTSLAAYDAEIKKIDTERKAVLTDKSDMSGTAIKERLKKNTALEERSKQLTEERKERFQRTTAIKTWINTQKQHWFEATQDNDVTAKRHLELLQECFLPRALYSSADAVYAYRMLSLLHSNNTPGFSLLCLMEQLLRKQTLAGIIFTCTAREAANFGRFLCDVLQLLQSWHAKKATYEKEALGASKDHTGFAMEFDEDGKPTVFVDFEEFRRRLFIWHNAIKDAFKACFESGETMHIYNGITVLKAVLPAFPALKFHGKAMQDAVKHIAAVEKRDDLKLMALSLQGPLKAQEKKWVIPQDFKMSNAVDAPANGHANGDTEMAEESDTKLNGAAPEFTPADTNVKAEDGEIEDEPAVKQNGDVKMTDSNVPASETAEAQTKVDTPASESVIVKKDIPAKNTEAKRLAPNDTLPAKPPASHINGRNSNRSDDRFGRLERPTDVQGRQRSRSPANRSQKETRERPPLRNRDSASLRDDHTASRSPRPSAPPAAHPERASQLRSEAPAVISSVVSQSSVNPARAALINGDNDRRPQRAQDASEHRADAPTGPRGSRQSGDRDLFTGYDRGTPSEPTRGRGRLGRDAPATTQGESTYGRLNGGMDSPDRMPPPNGPSRGPRAREAPPLNSRASDTDLRALDQPPRRPHPNDRGFEQPPVPARSAPSTPAAESGHAIHPSRLANLGNTIPPIDTNGPHPPSGPRAQNRRVPGTPTGPSPTSTAPPGPGSDRPRRGERRSDSANGPVNSTPTGQGTQFRGAARQFQDSRDQEMSARAVVPAMDAAAPRIDPGRQELIQRNTRGYDERQDRPSRNSSRERYPDDNRGYREEPPRDRRPREDDVPPRRPPPQSVPSGPGMYGNAPEYNARGPQRGYQERAAGPPRGPDDFRSSRGSDMGEGPRGDRKRRHEDGQGAFDSAKRRRSGN